MDSQVDHKRRVLDSKPVSPSLFAHFVLRTSNRTPLRWSRSMPVPVGRGYRRPAPGGGLALG